MARKLARLLPHPAQHRPSRGLRHPRRLLTPTNAGLGVWNRPTHTSTGLCGQLLSVACTPAFVLDGLETPTRPHLPSGGHPITIVVADDKPFVEHLGNAGRPHRPRRPHRSLHQPSGWSRSYVLASLRALHLDQHQRPGAIGNEGLDRQAHTGNATLTRSSRTQRAGCSTRT